MTGYIIDLITIYTEMFCRLSYVLNVQFCDTFALLHNPMQITIIKLEIKREGFMKLDRTRGTEDVRRSSIEVAANGLIESV